MDLQTLRHSTSHILADAVQQLFSREERPRLGIGPATDDGFYYDFDVTCRGLMPFREEFLPKIEDKMREIIKADLPFKKEVWSKDKARNFFKAEGETYKQELINEIPDKEVTIYKHGNFVDLCKGPHIESTGQVKAFKLLSVAGAYWRGIETNPMLQRIYGTAFETKKELNEYLRLIEEAQRRDHRKLGKELRFFSFHPEMGAGLVLYHPNGGMLRTLIEDWERKEHLKRGYQIVIGPHILKSDIWIRSGHYDYYKDLMFIFQIDGQEYAVKPMNCPGHMLIYKSQTRSYKELPIRYFELGSVYRNEKGGVLHGLLRVRGFTQDDAHIFCLPQQLTGEIIGVIDFVIDAMKTFGFEKYQVELSTRPPKSIGTDQDWEKATQALIQALQQKGLDFDINEGEGAFYGPKIDIQLKDALGRSWQCATIQCDFALPERFELTYVGQDGKEYRPVMLHRVILGSMERFMGALLEHYGGALPLWLSPTQVRVISISDTFQGYANQVKEVLRQADVRVELDSRSETLSYRIREAQVQKIPYMLVVGQKEKEAQSVSVRTRTGGDQGQMGLQKFAEKISKEVRERK